MPNSVSSGEAIAEAYLHNASNRGIFERAEWFAAQHGCDPADPVGYVLGPEFRATAVRELDEIAPKWERHLRTDRRRVLDAGCGPGITTLALAARYPGAEVLGVDVEDPALDLARHLAAGSPECRFENSSIEALDDAEGFDIIQCRMVIEHVYDAPRATARLVELLRPGGTAYIETPNYLWPWEPHVRLPMLPRSPKRILAAQCRLTGRDAAFIEHLNFECDPISMRRWVQRTDPTVQVVDLTAEKAISILGGHERPRVAHRARAIDAVRRFPIASKAARWALTRLPIAPSVMIVAVRPPV